MNIEDEPTRRTETDTLDREWIEENEEGPHDPPGGGQDDSGDPYTDPERDD